MIGMTWNDSCCFLFIYVKVANMAFINFESEGPSTNKMNQPKLYVKRNKLISQKPYYLSGPFRS